MFVSNTPWIIATALSLIAVSVMVFLHLKSKNSKSKKPAAAPTAPDAPVAKAPQPPKAKDPVSAPKAEQSSEPSLAEMALELNAYLVSSMAAHRDQCVFGSMKDHDGDKLCTKDKYSVAHGGLPSAEYDSKKDALAACKNDSDCVMVSKMINSEKYGTFRDPAIVWSIMKEARPDYGVNQIGLNEKLYNIGLRDDEVETSVIMMPSFKSGMAMTTLRYDGKKLGQFFMPIWNETALRKMSEKAFRHTTLSSKVAAK